jgi:signal transduction histidine kinase
MSLPAVQVTGVYNAQLVSMVGHELRHPLVPIRNAAALLGNTPDDPAAVRRAAEIIEREAVNLDRLIGDLVDVSRMQSGALELRCRRAPLSELMARAIESAELFARDHGHQVSVSVSPEPIYLHMDVLRLGQALHNIIANACQYTGKHGFIHVRAQRNGTKVSIVVSDTGNGIPAGQLESIFGLFAQAGQGGRIQAGLGLGLYLARCFVEAHGGTVTAASAGENRGSEFTIGLPCEPSTALVPEPSGAEPAVDRFPA